jgi:pimeloyl-ACP methyl ester carboxylesterase
MSSWQSGDVEANGLRLHYTRTGGAKPPVVLAHGFSDDGLCWTPVAEALEAEYDVIMVDARGHGRSEAPEQGYGSVEQAEDLRGVIAALELQRPPVLGHSMGAATTLVLAGTYPDVPGAILLEDPPARWMPGSERSPSNPEWQARMRTQITEFKRKTREELIAEQRAKTPGWSEAELGPWADSKLRLSPNVINRSGAAEVDWQALLRRITCPALLITADPAQGAIVSEESATALRELVPQLRVAHVPGAGHSIRRDQFGRYIEIVRAFLAEVTAKAA